jgi:hypothetical protein
LAETTVAANSAAAMAVFVTMFMALVPENGLRWPLVVAVRRRVQGALRAKPVFCIGGNNGPRVRFYAVPLSSG